MTPQEKAKELVETMLAQMPTISPIPRTSDMRKSAQRVGYLTQKAAKNCALTAVDEILKIGVLNDEEIYLNSVNYYNYWADVKQEIEKL